MTNVLAAKTALRPLYIPSLEAVAVKQALEVFSEHRLTKDTLRRLIRRYGLANQTVARAPLRISAPGWPWRLIATKMCLPD
ncbi:hypothetical protein [Mesorhizobium carmichaelinearum]|uniref:hypothetical protein n=1 Tax=Mesorhizobium carmichaelinearum TaxID=1208188 RepID=UPI000BA33C38|nr:hypothetical protein [Mesorhizobium carmichaelinearum]